MRFHAFAFRREAERRGDAEGFERFHLTIEPGLRIGAQGIGPTDSCTDLRDA